MTPENDYGALETGQTTISFASKGLANSNLKNEFTESNLEQKPFATELGLITDNINEIVKVTEQNGATILEEPKQKLSKDRQYSVFFNRIRHKKNRTT